MLRMAAPVPGDLESRAERAVRRGELLHALELYESLLAQRPDDERIRNRMDSVRALLHPSEMVGRRRAEPEEPERMMETLSDAELGEMHASSGRFDEAVASYRRAVEAAPKNELLRERLDELRKLLPPDSRAVDDGLASAEVLAPVPTPPPLPRATIPKIAPPPSRVAPPRLPADPVAMLKALLDRVRAGRRKSPAGA